MLKKVPSFLIVRLKRCQTPRQGTFFAVVLVSAQVPQTPGQNFAIIPGLHCQSVAPRTAPFKKTRVEKDRPALGDVSGNDRALAAQIPS